MIGLHVRYTDSYDKKEYLVIDYSPAEGEYLAEICILVDYPYHPDIVRQEKCWQRLDKFTIVDSA
jgi:hypothetical protein